MVVYWWFNGGFNGGFMVVYWWFNDGLLVVYWWFTVMGFNQQNGGF